MMRLSRSIVYLFILAANQGLTFAQNDVKTEIEKKLSTICKEPGVKSFFTLRDSSLSIYSSAANKQKNKDEFFITYNELESLRMIFAKSSVGYIDSMYKDKGRTSLANYFGTRKIRLSNKSDKSKIGILSGKVIVIDAGHISHDMQHAKWEGKYLSFKADAVPNAKEDLEIMEGRNTFGTSLLLKEQLEKVGATVFLTRNKPGVAAFGATFEEWLKSDTSGYKNKQLTDKQKTEVFMKKYNNLDLVHRTRFINEVQPDLTAVIHYNVDEKNTAWKKPTSKNFTMAFISGALWTHDMDSKRNRIELLRMLVTDDILNSEKVAGYLVNEFENSLKIPAAKITDADYLQEKCIALKQKGVYARNLALTRLVHCPIVYGESLYQDNEKECVMLCKKDIDIKGEQYPNRIKEVANAYFNAICNYFSDGK